MEIGSFIELALEKGKEFYNGTDNVARLNSGRSAIYHATRIFDCDIVYLPVYQCETVRTFLLQKGVQIKYYYIDNEFNPLIDNIEDNACIVLVNYFGIMSRDRMKQLASRFKKVIIDNSQAFFSEPIEYALNVYSARKFIGVPDGAYVIGENATTFIEEYEQCYSSDTSLFLLQRIEYGCEGKTYANRTLNEERLDKEDVLKMSRLTKAILDGCQYDEIIEKRRNNFKIAVKLFSDINQLNVEKYYDETCVPMIYPFVFEDECLLSRLLNAKHFQGHWWNYLLEETCENSFEHWLSKYMIPITIDQRYGEQELEYIRGLI